MRFHRTLALSTGCLLAGSAIASAQVTSLVMEGDLVPGVGNITQFDNIAINSAGDWMAEVRTDNPNNQINKALLKNGALYFQEGQALSAPAGAILKKFDSVILGETGDTVMNLTIDVGGNQETAVYWNSKLIMSEGDPAPGFTPGTQYLVFHEVRMNSNNQVAVICEVDDAQIIGGDDYAIMQWDLDASGNVTTQTILMQERENGGTAAVPIINMNETAHIWDFNDSGEFMFNAVLNTGAGASDDVVILNQTGIVEESFPSPLAGRNWNSVTSPEMAMNNQGDWVVSAGITGAAADNQLIVVNNVKLVQEGDSLASAGGFNVVSFGTGPVELSDNGDVVWFCTTDNPDNTQNSGIFVNMDAIARVGVTQVGPNVITGVVGEIDGYHINNVGTRVIFEGTLDNGLDGVFLAPIQVSEPGSPMCFGDGTGGTCPCGNFGSSGEGCQNSVGVGAKLSATGSPSIGASSASFNASGLPANKPTLLVSNFTQSTNFFGDGMTCIGSTWTPHSVVFSSGSGVANWGAAQIANPNFIPGQDSYFQVFYRDQGGPCGSAFNSSSAYKITFVP